MNDQNLKNTTVEAPEMVANDAPAVDAAPKKRTSRSRKKVVAPVENEEIKNVETPAEGAPKVENKRQKPNNRRKKEATPKVEEAPKAEEQPKTEEAPVTEPEQPKFEEKPAEAPKPEAQQQPKQEEKPQQQQQQRPQVKPAPRMPQNLIIKDFCDLANNGSRIPLLNDQQIQQLTYEDALERYMIMEAILANVLDYDIVLSDTNIWLELLVGHTSSHSDPRVNARLQFERQLEFISKMMKRVGGKFMIMSETYEEVDRFATMQEPTNYKDADWKDEVLCRNVAARLAKRLMLSQQKENRLRIEGIGSESHHAAFADPAIIRRTVELFASGKKVLLLTNDASVGIRSLGMCDDLQRFNNIDDKTWRTVYEPQRPMVLTMDDLKLLDQFTRQYHFLMVAAGRQWMQDVEMREGVTLEKPLSLWLEGFRPGDRHERRSDRIEQQRRAEQEKAEKQRIEQEKREKAEQEKREKAERAEREKAERAERERQEQQRREEQRRADRERAAAEKARKAAEQQAIAEAAQAMQAEKEKPAAPAEEASAEQPVAPVSETVPAADVPATNENEAPAPAGAIGATAEMMDLIGPQSGEKKPRTRRGGRRRSGGNKNNNQNNQE